MLTRPVKAALNYRLRDNMAGMATMFGIIVAIYTLVFLLGRNAAGEGVAISAAEIAAAITLLVYGIIVPRFDIRFFTQNSLTRQDFFLVEQVAVVITAAVAALLSELVNLTMPLISGDAIEYYSLYDSMFGSGSHLSSLACVFLLGIAGYELGILIQGFYYRAAKPVMLLVSIGLPLLFFVGLPLVYDLPAVSSLLTPMARLLIAAAATPLSWCGSLLLAILVCTAGAWLFFRRAPLR